jgi:uncharacterized membrane protein YhaH (DUF805 family)
MFVLLNTLVLSGGFVLFVIASELSPAGDDDLSAAMWTIIALLGAYSLAIVVPSIAVVVRRFHDCDLWGRWYLVIVAIALFLPFVGFVAWIGMIVVMCMPGTPGPNRFGPRSE